MALKTKVKVGNINNLSDARYCSGMGVDLLGFSAIEGSDAYITPALYQELRGWITGPQTVVELYGIHDKGLVLQIIEEYQPDYLELAANELSLLPKHLTLPLIVAIDKKEDINLINSHPSVEYIDLTERDMNLIPLIPEEKSIFIKLKNTDQLTNILNHNRIQGISLQGTPEIRPGFKDYGDLADVLEELEEET